MTDMKRVKPAKKVRFEENPTIHTYTTTTPDSEEESTSVSRKISTLKENAQHLNLNNYRSGIVAAAIKAIEAEINDLDSNIDKLKSLEFSSVVRSKVSKKAISQLEKRKNDDEDSVSYAFGLLVLTLGAAVGTLIIGIKGVENICEPFLQDPESIAVAIVSSVLVNLISGYLLYRAVKSHNEFENEARPVEDLDNKINNFFDSYNNPPSN